MMGNNENYFNVSLIVMGKSQDGDHKLRLLKRKESLTVTMLVLLLGHSCLWLRAYTG